MKKEKWEKVCPICGSENYSVDKSNKYLEAVGSSTNYVCGACGNIFSFPLEIEKKNFVKLKNEFGHENHGATPQEKIAPIGFFEIRVFFKILGPFLILSGLAWYFAFNQIVEGIILGFAGILLLLFSFYRDYELKKQK